MRTRIEAMALTLLLMGAVAVGSAMASPSEGGPLQDSAWRLVDLADTALLADPRPTLRFGAADLSGSDGCNRFTGAYTASGDASGGPFRVAEELASTQMACPEPVMQQAAAFVAALRAARATRIEDGRLVLLGGDGEVLATLAPQETGLTGTEWQVVGYNNGRQAVVSLLADSILTLAFSADGRLSGSAGCNRYTASYETTGREIRIGPVAATRRMCAQPEGIMEQEAAFLQALQRAAVATFEGDRLELRDEDGALQVSATR